VGHPGGAADGGRAASGEEGIVKVRIGDQVIEVGEIQFNEHGDEDAGGFELSFPLTNEFAAAMGDAFQASLETYRGAVVAKDAGMITDAEFDARVKALRAEFDASWRAS